MLTAITREVSASINNCELSFHARKPIDVAKAIAQHKAYQDCLAELGVQIVSLPAELDLPDSVFVEDAAVVVDEERFRSFQFLDVPDEEPASANALLIKDVVIIPASFPKTRALLEKRGFRVRVIDLCELQKTEAGVTCGSLIFNHE